MNQRAIGTMVFCVSVLSLFTGESAFAKIETFRLKAMATVRVYTHHMGRNYLEYVTNLGKGSVIAVDTGNRVGTRSYNEGTQIYHSQYGWYKGVKLVSLVGEIHHENLRKYEGQALYISETFKNVAELMKKGSVLKAPSKPGGTSAKKKMALGQCSLGELIQKGVPERPLRDLHRYTQENGDKIPNKNWASIGDFSQSSSRKRFYLLDLKNCQVTTEYVAHGSGLQGGVYRGDPAPRGGRGDGMLDRCSYNGSRKNMTRAGFMLVKGWFHSTLNWPDLNPRNGADGIALDGLEARNEEVRRAAVVMHEGRLSSGVWYVFDRPIIQGRSFGCPAFAQGRLRGLLKRTGNEFNKGTLYYSYAPQCD